MSKEKKLLDIFLNRLEATRDYNFLNNKVLEGIFEYYANEENTSEEDKIKNLQKIVDIFSFIDFEKIIGVVAFVNQKQLETIIKLSVEESITPIIKGLIIYSLKTYSNEDFILELFKKEQHTEQMFVNLITKKFISWDNFIKHGYINEKNKEFYEFKTNNKV